MADRHTLHISLIEAFKEWLLADGWCLQEPKGYYEVIRARKGKKGFIAYKRLQKNLQHLSVSDKDSYIIRSFLRGRKSKDG